MKLNNPFHLVSSCLFISCFFTPGTLLRNKPLRFQEGEDSHQRIINDDDDGEDGSEDCKSGKVDGEGSNTSDGEGRNSVEGGNGASEETFRGDSLTNCQVAQ